MKLLIIGDDKISRKVVTSLPYDRHLRIVVDTTSLYRRVLRLLRRGSLTAPMLLQMAWAEMCRKGEPAPPLPTVKNNHDILSVIKKYGIDTAFLFRTGIIINSSVLATDVNVMNIHCAKLPDYAGLGAIYKALKNEEFYQEATLHRVAKQIDLGETVETLPYALRPELSYRHNEDIAYEAGAKLLARRLVGDKSADEVV